MAYLYNVPITLFPGSVAPASLEEFADRVDADVTVTVALEEPRVKYAQITTSPAVCLVFVSEPSAGEKTTVDTLAGNAPAAQSAKASDWMANIDASEYRGYFEDFGAETQTTNGPTVRMNESVTLAGGRYEIEWTSELTRSSGSNDMTARFIFDRGGGEQFIDAMNINGPTNFGASKFNGRIQRVLPAGTYAIELEVEKISGSGSSIMSKSTLSYGWKGTS